jgi:retron-type reverse transcriptase
VERRAVSVGHNQAAKQAASPSIAVPVSLVACYAAWIKARRGKRPSANQLAFEYRWLDRLLELKTALRAGRWQPARTVSFVVTHPKTREIHAPDFADRIVHHLLVERLEKLYEPVFIHDSYANRKGRGSHAAVDRLQQFMRSRNGHGWYLQLDIHNYFNSINRHILYRMVCKRLQQCESSAVNGRVGTPLCPRGCVTGANPRGQTIQPSAHPTTATPPPPCRGRAGEGVETRISHHFYPHPNLPPARGKECGLAGACAPIGDGAQAHPTTANFLALRSLCHKLLANKVTELVRDPVAAANVPPHKRLANAAPGCGLPVGNLTSQFFANVYLNALDQFVKHTLKCRHYVRYVDDFVLLADDAAQLRLWQAQIEKFLADTLALKIKDAVVMQPLSQGIDFLGYRVFTDHRRVRPRVVAHCRAKLQDWAARHVMTGRVGTYLCPRGQRRLLPRGHKKRAHPTELRDWAARNVRQTPQGACLVGNKSELSGFCRSGFIPTQPLSCRDKSRPTANLGHDALAHLQAMLGSYWGHFAHAQSVRLRRALFEQFPWLKPLFVLHPDGQLSPRWVLQGATFAGQVAALKAEWPQARCLIQKGNRWLLLPGFVGASPARERKEQSHTGCAPTGDFCSDRLNELNQNPLQLPQPTPALPFQGGGRGRAKPTPPMTRGGREGFGLYGQTEFDEQATRRLTASLRRQGIAYVCANQTGWLRHGTRRREVQEWFSPNAPPNQ